MILQSKIRLKGDSRKNQVVKNQVIYSLSHKSKIKVIPK